MEINKNQLGTIFVAFIFFGSTFAFAMNWIFPEENNQNKELPNVFSQPISDSQRKYFLDNDVTILSFFYTGDEDKSTIERLAKEFGGRLQVEEIDIMKFQLISSEYNVRSSPVIIIRGKKNLNQPIRLESIEDYSTMKSEVCSTFENPPVLCG